MKTTEESVKTVATMLAAAYWRGKLNAAGLIGDHTTEAMVTAAAQREWEGWCGSARQLLGMLNS